MRQLEDLGFSPGGDEAHLQIVDPTVLEADRFFAAAAPLLGELGGIVLSDVVPNLEQRTGRWHPLGFMVYPLGVHPAMGSLRLHIWPHSSRVQRFPQDSGIHNHAWYIASRVLAGEYSDDRYILGTTELLEEDQPVPEGFRRVFRPHKEPGQPDYLATDGTIAVPVKTSEVRAVAGDMHTITPEVYHLPTIPVSQLAVTLVLDSPSFGYEPSVVVNGDRGPAPFSNPRVSIEPHHAIRASQQILAA